MAAKTTSTTVTLKHLAASLAEDNELSKKQAEAILGGAEGDLLAGLDLDLLAGGGVAAHARGALADLEDAEADDADALTLLQVFGDHGHQIGQDGFGLLLGQLLLLGDGRGEVLEGDGG